MKNLRTNRARVILGFVFILITVMIVTVIFLSKLFGVKNKGLDYVTLANAPQSILYREYGEVTYIQPGISYQISDSGDLVISIDGNNYVVKPDGSVWLVDENGNLVRVTDPEIVGQVLSYAYIAEQSNSDISHYIDKGIILDNLDLTTLSDDEIIEIAKEAGVNAKELLDEVHEAQSNGESLSLSEALETLDLTSLSDEELVDLANLLGLNPDEVLNIIHEAQDNGQAVSLAELYGEILKNDDTVLIDSFITAAAGGDENYYKNLGLEGLDGATVIAQLAKSTNPETGKPYTAEEFMQDAMRNGIEQALTDIGFEIKDKDADDELLTYSDKSTDSPQSYTTYVPGSFLGDITSNSIYDPSQDLTYLANALSEVSSASDSADEAQPSTYIVQNGQSSKVSFLQSQQTGTTIEVAKNTLNMITAGTIINGTLVTGVNSDLPGQIVAIVSQNVYDSFHQTNLLIPKGSRLVATYDSSITWGQDRILIAWNQLIRQDGLIINLNGYQGIDNQGYAGQGGDVNNHIWSIIGATGVATMVEYFSSSTVEKITNSLLNALVSGTNKSVNEITQQLLERQINRQPTITVKEGTKISILVNDNVVIPTYKD